MEPPEDTRAYFRGRCIARTPTRSPRRRWDSIIFDTARTPLQRVPMREPLQGTEATSEDLLERRPTRRHLVEPAS